MVLPRRAMARMPDLTSEERAALSDILLQPSPATTIFSKSHFRIRWAFTVRPSMANPTRNGIFTHLSASAALGNGAQIHGGL